MWVKDQDPLQRKSNVTCQVPCSCGYVYIGQKKRAHKTRMKEHKVATRRGDMEKSAIAKCAWNHHHQVDWDKIKMLDKVAISPHYSSKKPLISASQTWIHWWTMMKASKSQTVGWQSWAMPNLWWGWRQAPTSTGMMTSLIMMQMQISGSKSGKKAKVEAETQD